MAGRVEERDLSLFLFALRARHGNGVGTDVLRDAAGLAGRDIRFADDVEQRGFAMIHVTHDGDDRRARLELFRLVLGVEFNLLGRCVDHAAAALALLHFKSEAVFRTKLLGDVFVNRLVDGGENAQLDQIADDDEWLLLELLGEFADDNRRLDDDDLGGGRRDEFRGRRRGGFGRLARGRRRLAAVAGTLKLLMQSWFLRRTRARRRRFGASALFAGARCRPRWQLDESDFITDFRASRLGRRRWRRRWRRWRRGRLRRFNLRRRRCRRYCFKGCRFGFGFGRRWGRRGDDYNFVLDRRGLGRFGRGFGREPGGGFGINFYQFPFEPLGGDFIQRAGRDSGGGNAHRLGLGENFLVLEAELFRNVVYPNGHKFSLPPTGMGNWPSWLKAREQKLIRSAS